MSEHDQQPEALFEAARRLGDPAHRAAFLDFACAGDAAMRKRLDNLLAAQAEADEFFRPLPAPPRPAAAPVVPEPMPEEHLGTMIGRYKLLQKIGEGGFGVVYLAEQKEPVKRRVALKIIKLGMDTKQVVARFEAERQALALMDHPNIAKIFDGGMTGSAESQILNFESPTPASAAPSAICHLPSAIHHGRPYFVMELVRGIPITQYCDDNQLSTDERLELFLQVCHAVQHAHQKGVIHRDLKPSNILVTLNDGQAVPKVIDFGVAKATQQALTDKTIVTQFHHFIGTPAYMSPEQATMASLDIDTRSDIYALGVLLYELLTGKTPFNSKELFASGLDEMRRTIREKEPPRPSTRLSTMAEAERTTAARLRKTESPKLIHQLRGDLDWIVMKCLEKDRNRRYETASGLAVDLGRHLNDEPVTARPPSITYRFQKMVHRNKLAFAATVTVVLALLAGIGATSWQAIRASHAEQRAEQRRRAAMTILRQAFDDVSPALARIIGGARPREILARAAADAIDDLQQEAELDVESRAVLGQLYLQQALVHGWYIGNTTGDYDAALRAVTNSLFLLEAAAAALPSDDTLNKLVYAEQAAAMIHLGLLKPEVAIEHFQKSHQWAARLSEQTTNASLRSQSEGMKETAIGNINDTLVRMGRVEEVLTNYFLPLLARLREQGDPSQSQDFWVVWGAASDHDSVGMAYCRLRRYREALPYLREAMRLKQITNQRRPHNPQWSSALALVQAETGEALLCLNEPEEGLQLLHDAAKLADDLADRDPANAGFTQVQIEVSWRGAAGCIAWADDSTGSPTERRSRLDRAEAHLRRAQSLLAGLKSESLRKFLATDLNPVIEKAAKVKANLGRP